MKMIELHKFPGDRRSDACFIDPGAGKICADKLIRQRHILPVSDTFTDIEIVKSCRMCKQMSKSESASS